MRRRREPVGRTVFHGGTVFDGSGSPPASADVVIEDGRIVEVGSGLDGDDGIDCAGKALLPGLFDCHVHLAVPLRGLRRVRRACRSRSRSAFYRSMQNLRTTIGLGITTVRDASGADAGLRIAVDEGTLVGPRMQVSVSMLSMTGGHNDPWLPSGTLGVFGVEYPGMPVRHVRRRRRGHQESARDGPGRRRRDQDRFERRVPLAGGRSDGAELLPGGGRRDRARRPPTSARS